LYVEHGAHQLGCARAVGDERPNGVAAAVPIEVARIDGATHSFGELCIVGSHPAAFAAGHVLVVVEAESAELADAAEPPALVTAADPLASVLDDDQIAPRGNRHDAVHVAGRAPHMYGNDGFRAWANGVLKRIGIDGQRLVDIDDDGDCADGEHRG